MSMSIWSWRVSTKSQCQKDGLEINNEINEFKGIVPVIIVLFILHTFHWIFTEFSIFVLGINCISYERASKTDKWSKAVYWEK